MDWVNIDGYKYVYQINEDGQVRWIDAYGFAHDLRQYTCGQKRTRVTMTRADGVKISVPVVNLMADAFMGGRIEGYNIIHKNGMKYDNRLSNLRFATKEETAQISANNRRKPVLKMLYDRTVVDIYPSATKAAKANYISLTVMCGLCKGKFEDSCRVDGFFYQYENLERGEHHG